MATTLPQSQDAAKGTYKVTQVAPMDRAVHIGCPSCGVATPLSRQAHITPDGEVRPTFLCECGFNDDLVLGNWASQRAEVPSVQHRGTNPLTR